MSSAAADLPAPLVPFEVDLRDFPFMPLDVMRLLNSEFYAIASDAEYRAGTTLWFSCWHEVPSGSLPDDDRILCHLARLGRDMRRWRRVKDVAMHGYIMCSDGRFYHPIIATKAIEAWGRIRDQKKRTEAARRALSQKAKRSVTEPVTEPAAEPVTDSNGHWTSEKDSPPPTPPATGGALVVAEGESSLEHRIMAAFMDRSVDKGLTWPPSEREHVTRLVERARAEPDPEAWIKRFLETAWRLKREGKGIWRGRPWMPRTFAGQKAITWVIEAMGAAPTAASMEDLEWLRQLVKGK